MAAGQRQLQFCIPAKERDQGSWGYVCSEWRKKDQECSMRGHENLGCMRWHRRMEAFDVLRESM